MSRPWASVEAWMTGLVRLAVAGAAVAGTSCDLDRGPLSPVQNEPAAVLARDASGQRSLERELEAEKARIFWESERSKGTYDSLKVEWDRLRMNYGVTGSGIVLCDPLQYAADTKIIGAEGADLSIGPHKLSIPRGALTEPVVITGEMPVSLSVGVRLSPHGLVFAKQPKLTLNYQHCLLPSRHLERVAYVDESLNVLEYPVSRDRSDQGLVEGWLAHFSGYAVSW